MDSRAVAGTGAPADETLLRSEHHLRLACEAGRLGTWEWIVATDQVIWSPSLEAIHGLAPGTFHGTFADFQKDIHPDDRESVLRAIDRTLRHGDDHHVEYRVVQPDGGISWVEGRGKLFRDRSGAPTRMIGVCMDVTARKQAEEALRASEQRFVRFMEQFPGLAWIKDVEGRYVYANEGAQRAFRAPAARLYGRTDEDIFPSAVAARFHDNDRRALASQTGVQVVETLDHDDGVHHSLVSKFPIFGPDGRVAFIGGMAVDITDRMRAEARQKLLLDELGHRVKNTLAIVQSIVGLTLRETPEPAAFAAAFSARLAALARAHSLLTGQLWQGASLHDLVAAALAPFGGGTRPGAIRVDGPPVVVGPDAAVTLSLVFHELAANAAKHGALTMAAGALAVSWTRTAAQPAQPPRIELVWSERGGPAVAPPKTQGFGARLIAASAEQLDGDADLRYEAEGFEFRFRFPLPDDASPDRP